MKFLNFSLILSCLSVILWLFCLNNFRSIDERALPFVEEFQSEGLLRGQDFSNRSVIITFQNDPLKPRLIDRLISNKKHDSIANCDVFFKIPKIKVHELYWNHYSDLEKRALIFHELGHCWLFKTHSKNKLSIMNSSMLIKNEYRNNWNNKVDDLFSYENYFQETWHFLEFSLAIWFLSCYTALLIIQKIWKKKKCD